MTYVPVGGGFPPAHHGFIAWSCDPQVAGANASINAGELHLTAVYLPAPVTITNVHLAINAGGTGLTANQCFAGLYQNGTLKASTANQATAWAGTGLMTMALSSPQNVAAGIAHIGWYWNGSGSPTFNYAGGNLVNANLAAAKFRGGYSGYYTTALPSTHGTISTYASFWGAVS